MTGRKPHWYAVEGIAQRRQRLASRQRGSGRSEDVPAMEGGRDVRWCRQDDDVYLGVAQDIGKDAVGGAEEAVPASGQRDRMPRAADTGIDDHQVDCSAGEAVPGPAQHVGRGSNVAGSDMMSDVNQDDGRSVAQQHPLQLGDVGIHGAEIGEEGDGTWGTWGTWGTRGTIFHLFLTFRRSSP